MSERKPKAPPPWIEVGAVVDYHSIIGGPVTQAGMVVRAGPQEMCGSQVVWLTGKAGCVAVEACTPTPPTKRGERDE